MATELSPIDITEVPELARLVEEVAATGKPRRIRRGTEDVAILRPAAPRRSQAAARERRFQKMLAVAQHPEVDGDALVEELERADAEQRARVRA